jgi:hypothetical protein
MISVHIILNAQIVSSISCQLLYPITVDEDPPSAFMSVAFV